MNSGYYNLDTTVNAYFDSGKVLVTLKNLNVNTLYDLYKLDISKLQELKGVGKNTIEIINQGKQTLFKNTDKRYSQEYLKMQLHDYLNVQVLISDNSDNVSFRNSMKICDVIEILTSSFSSLSNRDIINCNLFFNYIIDHYTTNHSNMLKIIETASPKNAVFKNTKDVEKSFLEILSNFDEREATIIKYRFGLTDENKTLEELGNEYKVTRERIRQIESRVSKEIKRYLKPLHYRIINFFDYDFYVYNDDYLDFYYDYLVSLKKYKKIKYNNKLLIINNQIDKEYIINYIDDYINKLNDFGKIAFDNKIDYFNFKRIFSDKYEFDNIYMYGKFNIRTGICSLVKKIDRPIDLNNKNDVDYIYDILETNYKVTSDYKDSRNIERPLIESCILINNRTYLYPDFQKRSNNDLMFINFIKERTATTADELYKTYQNDWNDINIYSPVGCYGYLKFFYPKEFNYSGKSMMISVFDTKGSWGELLNDYIIKYKRPVSYEEFHNLYPAVTSGIWMNLPLNFTNLINWYDNQIYSSDLFEITNDQKNLISIYIYNHTSCNEQVLFSYLLNTCQDLLNINHIYNDKQLKNFVLIIFDGIFHYDKINNCFYN